MFLRTVSKLLPVTEGMHFSSIERLPIFRRHDNLGNIVGVTIHRHTALEDLKGHAFFLEVSIIGTDQSRELGSSRVSADKDLFRVPTILRDMTMHPAERLGDVSDQGSNLYLGEEAIIDRDKNKAPLAQHPGLQSDIGFIPNLPPSSMDPKHHGQILPSRGFRRVDVENLTLVP